MGVQVLVTFTKQDSIYKERIAVASDGRRFQKPWDVMGWSWVSSLKVWEGKLDSKSPTPAFVWDYYIGEYSVRRLLISSMLRMYWTRL